MMSGRSLIGIGMCALVSLVGSTVVLGAEPAAAPAGTVTERLTALEEKTDAPGIWKSLGFQISGAVQASYTQNFNNPSTNLNQLRIFDTQANSFGPDVAQLMVERPATPGSATDRVGFRARLDFGPQARFSRARTNFQPGTDNNELDIHELYAEYLVPVGNGLKIQLGKINTLIGLEVINSWENPNFSRSFTFGLAQAFTETGIRFTYPITTWATAAVGLVNGWDNIEDNNRGKTVTWNLALTPHEKFGVTFYGSYGSEQSNGNAQFGNAATGVCANGTTGCDPTAKRTVLGGLITFKPTDKDTLIIEPYYGNEANATSAANNTSQNARWNAVLAYLTHDFNDQTQPNAFSMRVRGELFEDAGGARSCTGGNNFAGGVGVCAGGPGGFLPGPVGTTGGAGFNGQTGGGLVQTLQSYTFTLQYKPAPSLMTRTEFRHDISNKDAFLYGTRAVDNQSTLSFSVVYLF
jgi:Putative beta-barrel porin-2, OmpL-like. bbp2